LNKQIELDQIKKTFDDLGYSISDHQTLQFHRYYELLVETNKVMNLTAITEFSEVLTKHFVDSCVLMKIKDLNQCQSLIDIGTGAGFPGIPLKILFPHLNVTLLDSLNKRIRFLEQVVNELGLEKVELLHGRAEDYAHQKKYREQYDLCVSRAVANLSTLSEYCIPYVKKNGYFIPYKSGKLDEELNQAEYAIKQLGCVTEKSEKMILPSTDIERMFVFIHKINITAAKYPRKAGMPSKEPLEKK